MTDAGAQLNRIVSVIAMLSRQGVERVLPLPEGEGTGVRSKDQAGRRALKDSLTVAGGPMETGVKIEDLGREFGVSAKDIAADIRTLTLIGDHADAEWLLSLRVWQQEDRVSISSAGPFRRPLKFTPDEVAALKLALAMDPEGQGILRKLSSLDASSVSHPTAAAATPDRSAGAADLIAAAASAHRPVELIYAAESPPTPARWIIHPHQLVGWRDRSYIVAWCPDSNDWRHFRMDRVIEAKLAGDGFALRPDFKRLTHPAELFQPGEAVDRVRVRFAPPVARWARERHPDHEMQPDGSVIVTLKATSTEWLVRRVLEYGPDAEIVGPEEYREAVRVAVA